MQIISNAFLDNTNIPEKYAYKNDNISPPLSFINVPKNAKSLVLICHDPDAPTKNGWYHWLVWNIPANCIGFSESDECNNCIVGLNSYKEHKWGGPNPPSGTHRYIFYLYALNNVLELGSDAKINEIENAIKGHIIQKATLTGLYST